MYLIPANSKKGQLIFNLFRPIDLGIFLTGLFISLILMLAIKVDTALILALKLGPVVICSLLVMPVPNYHNVLMFLTDMINFYNNRRIYIWRGWCVSDESVTKEQ